MLLYGHEDKVNNRSLPTKELEEFSALLQSGIDPFIEEIIDHIPKPLKSKKNKSKKLRKNEYRKKKSNKFVEKRFSRASLVIVRFLKEDGSVEFRLQRDFNDKPKNPFDDIWKSRPGFVIGSPLDEKEPDNQVALRETEEETLIPQNMGTLEYVDVIPVKSDYNIHVFVKTVSFETEDGPGDQVYSHDRYTKEEVQYMVDHDQVLPNHRIAWNMAIAKGLI